MVGRLFSLAFLASVVCSVSAITLQGHVSEREPEAYFVTVVNSLSTPINVSAYYNLFDNDYRHKNQPLIIKDSSGNVVPSSIISSPIPPAGAVPAAFVTLFPGQVFMREININEFTVGLNGSNRQEAVTVTIPTQACGYVLDANMQLTGPEVIFDIQVTPYPSTLTVPASSSKRAVDFTA